MGGLPADGEGRPAPVQTYVGDTGDPSTAADQVEKLRERFDLTRVVLVGDRGMLTQARIEELKNHPHLGWISALRSEAIQSLVEQGAVQLSLFERTEPGGDHQPPLSGRAAHGVP